MTEERKKRAAAICAAAATFAVGLGLTVFEAVANDKRFGGDPPVAFTLGMSAAERLLLAAAVVCVSVLLGFGRLFTPRIKGGVIAFTAAAAVALANFPFFTLTGGELTFTANAGETALFLLNCAAIGAFEESAFRGLLLPLLFGAMKDRRYAGIFAAILSAAVFALFHLLNLISGAGAGATLLQVGYTFLTGCMFGALTLLTRSVIPGAVAHALFDVGGTMTAYGVAAGANWNVPSAIVMAVVSAAAGLYLLIATVRRTLLRPYILTDDEPRGDV